jgi:cytochrome b involved in lipid metabolism
MKKEFIFGLIMVLIVGAGLFFAINNKKENKFKINLPIKNFNYTKKEYGEGEYEENEYKKNKEETEKSEFVNPAATKKVEQETPKKSSFSMSDVAKHNNENDCWIVIDGKVYDVTNYIDSHPGGKVMANFCGQDGSLAFATKGKKNKPHKKEAYDVLKTLYIGDLSQ